MLLKCRESSNWLTCDAFSSSVALSETFRDFSWYKNRSRHSILYFVIVVDDENGDIEGNLIIAASLASPQQVSFLIKNGSGIVSVGMKEEDLERLKLPLMSPETENEDSSAPTLTITVDAKSGTCTGVSASDRAKTVLALSSPETKPEDFRRPGHVFPLKYRNGGVLRRAGHTEAYVDLVMLAGLPPVSVLSAIIDPDETINRQTRRSMTIIAQQLILLLAEKTRTARVPDHNY
ncbi:hypothetical protein D5086_013498 [Populus alba]|uniref:Uncharacterized protein n=1 Tax=Populus alba TaxID=43335 RepID=A0ACC4C6B6_POPAL